MPGDWRKCWSGAARSGARAGSGFLFYLVILLLGSCGSERATSQELTVFAASSLTGGFEELASAYEASHPDTRVRLNSAASSQLAAQISEGAPADVFASAGEAPMALLEEEGLVRGVRRFATNRLVVILPSTNPAGIERLADLAKPGLKLVTTGTQVPIGAYTREALAIMEASGEFPVNFASAVLANVVSEETNARQLITKVQLGEADAAIVYASDATPAVRGSLLTLPIPDPYQVEAPYMIATVAEANNPSGGESFVDFVRSPQGLVILEKWGFLPP